MLGESILKNFLFLCGANGIGKTTIAKEIIRVLPHTAYVDSDPCRMMNPFVLDDNTIPTISKNISDLITNYMNCPLIETVIFTYGFHGRRREVFDNIILNISKVEYRLVPFLLWCTEEENIHRMSLDGRSKERVKRAISESRGAFENISYPKIDITNLSPEQAAKLIIKQTEL